MAVNITGDSKDIAKRLEAALKLLEADSTTREKFESMRALIQGMDSRIDKKLGLLSKQLSELHKLEKGEVIELTAEYLPERNEEEKKRKRQILLLIKTWKDLRGEVKRIQAELSTQQTNNSSAQQFSSWTKIVAFAKGPFGIITIAALFIVGLAGLIGNQQSTTNVTSQDNKSINQTINVTSSSPKTKAIKVGEKMIALTELTTGQGTDCMSGVTQALHYHAKDHTASRATDGNLVLDPGGCGFGKVDEVDIILVE